MSGMCLALNVVSCRLDCELVVSAHLEQQGVLGYPLDRHEEQRFDILQLHLGSSLSLPHELGKFGVVGLHLLQSSRGHGEVVHVEGVQQQKLGLS